MNVATAKKICKEVVEDLLPAEAKGTKMYLKIMRDSLEAFESPDLTASQRLCKLATILFILRIWRRSIEEDKNKSLEQFITHPTYVSFEINFHALINLIRLCRETHTEFLFQYLFFLSSQECEALFRALRSMTTLYWTNVNFSILDILYKIRRLNYARQCDLILEKIEHFIVPREHTYTLHSESAMPSDEDIDLIISSARAKAFELCKQLGIVLKDGEKTELKPMISETKKKKDSKLSQKLVDSQLAGVELRQSDTIIVNAESNFNDDPDAQYEEDRLILDTYCTNIIDSLTEINSTNKTYYMLKLTNEPEDNRHYKMSKFSFVRLLNSPDFVHRDRTKRFIRRKDAKMPENPSSIMRLGVLKRLDDIIIKGYKGVARIMDFKILEKKGR